MRILSNPACMVRPLLSDAVDGGRGTAEVEIELASKRFCNDTLAPSDATSADDFVPHRERRWQTSPAELFRGYS